MTDITFEQLKKALYDKDFRNLWLPEFEEAIEEWMNNPGCKCNVPFYKTMLADENKLKGYFGNDINIIDDVPIEDEQINHWTVFNGHIDKLEEFFQSLPNGPKQMAIARYEDQVTVVVNDPEF